LLRKVDYHFDILAMRFQYFLWCRCVWYRGLFGFNGLSKPPGVVVAKLGAVPVAVVVFAGTDKP